MRTSCGWRACASSCSSENGAWHTYGLSHAALAHLRHHRLAAEKRSLRSTRAALRAQVKEKRAAVQEVVAEITALVEVSRARRREAELLLMRLAPRRRQRRSRSD